MSYSTPACCSNRMRERSAASRVGVMTGAPAPVAVGVVAAVAEPAAEEDEAAPAVGVAASNLLLPPAPATTSRGGGGVALSLR